MIAKVYNADQAFGYMTIIQCSGQRDKTCVVLRWHGGHAAFRAHILSFAGQEYFLVALSQPRAEKDDLFVAPSEESKTSENSVTAKALVRMMLLPHACSIPRQ